MVLGDCCFLNGEENEMKRMIRWIAIGLLGSLVLIGIAGTGLTDDKGKCGGYLEKCDTNGKITCAEARKCGLKTPITKDHPAYTCMTDRDKDGVVCE